MLRMGIAASDFLARNHRSGADEYPSVLLFGPDILE